MASHSTAPITAAPSTTITDRNATQTTIDVFWTNPIPFTTSNIAGWVLGADACETTVLLSCTVSDACDPIQAATFTQGPSHFVVVVASTLAGLQGFLSISCTLPHTESAITQAVCHQELSLVVQNNTTVSSDVVTYSGANITSVPIPITAGAEALSSITGSCTTTTTTTTTATTSAATSIAQSSQPWTKSGGASASAPTKGGLSTGADIAIGVSVPVGVLIAAFLGAAVLRSRRKSRASEPKRHGKAAELASRDVYEMESERRLQEIDAQSNERLELDAIPEMDSGLRYELHELDGTPRSS